MSLSAAGGVGGLFHLPGGVLHVILRWIVLPLALLALVVPLKSFQRLGHFPAQE